MSSVLSYINNLGTFDSMKAVWERYPEGGREGDYVTIGGLKYGWNKYDLIWEYNYGKDAESAARSATTFDGDVFMQNDLTVAGTLRAKHIPNPNCGLYKDLASLQAAHPDPDVGMWAVVGDTIPGYIYRCETDGFWSATGEIGGGDSIDSDYVMKKLDETAESLNALNMAVSRSVRNDQLGTLFTSDIAAQKRVIDGTDAGMWRVMYQSKCIGVLEVFADSQNHCITQVLTTNATPDGEGGITDSHRHEVKQFGRMYNIRYASGVTADGELWPVGSWSSWKEISGSGSSGSGSGSSGSGSSGSGSSGSGSSGSTAGVDAQTVDALEASFCSLVLCLMQREPVVFAGFAPDGTTVQMSGTDLTDVLEGLSCPIYYVKGSGLGIGYFCYLRNGKYYATWTGSDYDFNDYQGTVLAYRQSDEKLFLFKTGVSSEVYTVPFGLTLSEARNIATGGSGGALKVAQDALKLAQSNLESIHVNTSDLLAVVRCLLKKKIVHFRGVLTSTYEVSEETLVAENESELSCPVYYLLPEGSSSGRFVYFKDGVYYGNWSSELYPQSGYQGDILCHKFGSEYLYMFKSIGVHPYHMVSSLKYTEAVQIMAGLGSGSSGSGSDGGSSGSGGTDYSDEIAALQNTVSGHANSLQTLQAKNDEQDATLSGHASSLQTLQTENNSQQLAITSLRNKDASQDTDIEALQSEVAALKAGGSSGSGSGTVSWAIDLGESDNSANSDMPYKAPSRAADPSIAGNKNIRRILFTATDGEKTYGAYIEQVVYEKACVQMMFINGRRFDRFIDFTDYTRTTINTATSVGGIQPWQRTDPRNLSYNASTRRLALANMWGQNVGSDVQLPLSTDSADGLMPKGTLADISQLKSDVATLRNTVEAGGSSGSGSSGGTTDTAQLNAELTVLEQCLLGGQLVEIAGVAPEGTTLTLGSVDFSTPPTTCPIYLVPGTNAFNGGFGCIHNSGYWENWTNTAWAKEDYPKSGTAIAYETGTSTVYLIKSTVNGWTYTRIGVTDKATFESIRDRYATAETVRQQGLEILDLQKANTNATGRLDEVDNIIQSLLDADTQHEAAIRTLQGNVNNHTTDITQLKSDVAALQAGSGSGSGSSDGVDAAQMEAEIKVLEQCLLGGNLAEIAGVVNGTLTNGSTNAGSPSSCPIYFVNGSSAFNSGFGFRSGTTYYSGWNLTGDWARSNYYPSSGPVVVYNLADSKVYLYQNDLNEANGWKYHLIGATDKATFDAIRARYTAVEELRTTTAGHETRIATLETDVAALQAGSGSSGSGSTGSTAEVLTVDVGALDSLCSSVEVAKSLIQHPEKMRYVVTATSGGVTIAVGELVMYADAGGKQVTQELRSHYLITGNNINSSAVRLDAMNTFCRSFGVLSANNSYSTVGAWTFWRPKDGVIQLGESDVTTNSYMQDNVPTLLKLPLICGNKYISRIVFTVTKNNLTHSGIVDQQVSGTTCMQRLSMDSRLFTRYIYFTDDSRGILKGNPQGWQYSEPRNLSYDQRTGLLKMTNMWGNNVGSSVTLQLSNDSAMGLVPAGTLSKLGTLYGAQQRTWALYEPALQFDFFEKHPREIDGTLNGLWGHNTSFQLFRFSKTSGDNLTTSYVNSHVFLQTFAPCPTSYTYDGVTYDTVNRYLTIFRKINRSNRKKRLVDAPLEPALHSKRKRGYVEFLRGGMNDRRVYYEDGNYPAFNLKEEYGLADFRTLFSYLIRENYGPSYNTLCRAKHYTLFQRNNGTGAITERRRVGILPIGLCLVLQCKKDSGTAINIYGPMIKGNLVSTYYIDDDYPCSMVFTRK